MKSVLNLRLKILPYSQEEKEYLLYN